MIYLSKSVLQHNISPMKTSQLTIFRMWPDILLRITRRPSDITIDDSLAPKNMAQTISSVFPASLSASQEDYTEQKDTDHSNRSSPSCEVK